jgi:hypothetical protein
MGSRISRKWPKIAADMAAIFRNIAARDELARNIVGSMPAPFP